MKKYAICLLLLLAFLPVLAFAQNTTHKEQTLGNCSSYTITGNQIVFSCENNAKVQVQLCSGEVLKTWVSATGNFTRSNPSFAVVNEDLGWSDTIEVKEEVSAYELFTASLRIRVNKAPFKLQVFDKYQKLLFSDYNEKGFLKQGSRQAAYKHCAAMSSFLAWAKNRARSTAVGTAIKCGIATSPVTVSMKTRCTRAFLFL
jgi:alpha-glucosidase